MSGQWQQGGFLSLPTISPAGCSCREHVEKGEHKPGSLPSFMPQAHGFSRAVQVQGILKTSSFALLFFPLSQGKMLVWTLCSSLLYIFPKISSERSWEPSLVWKSSAVWMLGWFFPRELSQEGICYSLWFSHTEAEEIEVLFLPRRLNPYLYISILWAIKLFFSFFLFSFCFSHSFVFTLFCGVSFEVPVPQVWEMCWSCLLYKGEHRGQTLGWEASDRSSPRVLLQCANTFIPSPKPVNIERKK